ncbi:MAG: hypothetical protein ACR2FK_04985 [Sphingomicrobium sp.]
MQERLILATIAISLLTPAAAVAGEIVRRPLCPKIEPQRQPLPQQQVHQQRVRTPECRSARPVPPVVDPMPFFLL